MTTESLVEQFAEQVGKNVVVDERGSISEAVIAPNCLVSFVDCDTKKTVVATLKPGDTLFYGDWNGTSCVRKKFTCPK